MSKLISTFLRRIAVLLALLAAQPSFAVNTMFLQIDGMPGESTDIAHAKWIDIDSFSWGITNTPVVGGANRAVVDDFEWFQPVDISSPKVFVAVASGKHTTKVTLDVVRAGGKPGDSFFQMIFDDVLFTKFKTAGNAGTIIQNAALAADNKITLRYRQQDNAGRFGSWVEGSFNIKANTASLIFEGNPDALLGLFQSGGNIGIDLSAITVVPEPGSAVLLAAGLALVALVAVRRRRAA